MLGPTLGLRLARGSLSHEESWSGVRGQGKSWAGVRWSLDVTAASLLGSEQL